MTLLIEEDDEEESWLLDDTLDTVSLRNEIIVQGRANRSNTDALVLLYVSLFSSNLSLNSCSLGINRWHDCNNAIAALGKKMSNASETGLPPMTLHLKGFRQWNALTVLVMKECKQLPVLFYCSCSFTGLHLLVVTS